MSSRANRSRFSSTSHRRLGVTAVRPAVPPGPYLVLGLGRAGRAAQRALSDRFGAHYVRTWDDGPKHGFALEDRQPGDPAHRPLVGIRTVVKSPGVPFTHPLVHSARRVGLDVLDELELGWRLSSRPLIAVTGTNGKSTTTCLVAAALRGARLAAVQAGNVEASQGVPYSALVDDGHGWVVAEVSSYQAQGLTALLPQASVLTNLTPDHLHWHGSMAAYARAKRRLFIDRDRTVALAVVNLDDRFGRRLARDVRERGGRVVSFGRGAEAEVRIGECHWDAHSGHVQLDTPEAAVTVSTQLPGEHNAANVAAAVAVAHGLGLALDDTLAALSNTASLPGRMEALALDTSYDVIVDFAHSPDSLERALATMRAIAGERGGRLIAVVGLAPSGERSTRVSCGRIARAGCDHLVLSAWSLKGEPPLISLSGLLAGARQGSGAEVEVVPDRRRAIARALTIAGPGDVVGVLGRGALSTMRTDARSSPVRFDDRIVVRELLARDHGHSELDH